MFVSLCAASFGESRSKAKKSHVTAVRKSRWESKKATLQKHWSLIKLVASVL